MKLLFVINTMQGGGAARVTAILANQLVKNGYQVAIATNMCYKTCTYQLAPEIKLVNIYGKRQRVSFSLTRLMDHIIRLKKVICSFKPDIIIAEQEDGIIFSRLATLFCKIPIIGHRHNTFKILGISRLQRLIFNSVNRSVFLHDTDVKFVGDRIKNATYIYNPCSFPIVRINQNDKKNIIVTIGSTKRYLNKGFDLLLDIWAGLSPKYPNWSLHIIGGGSEENERLLRSKAASLGILDNVVFTGNVDDVQRRLYEASIFVLPSRVEGFPMVLNEAISQGCACVSFALQGVINEIFTKDAILVASDGNINEFSECVEKLLSDIQLRNKIVGQSQTELERYSPEEIVKQWDRLILDVCDNCKA